MTWKPDPKTLPTVADRVRVTCRLCGMVTVKMEHNVSLFTRGHMNHHKGEQPDFAMETIVPNTAPQQPEAAR